jgi:hypothetical protein
LKVLWHKILLDGLLRGPGCGEEKHL